MKWFNNLITRIKHFFQEMFGSGHSKVNKVSDDVREKKEQFKNTFLDVGSQLGLTEKQTSKVGIAFDKNSENIIHKVNQIASNAGATAGNVISDTLSPAFTLVDALEAGVKENAQNFASGMRGAASDAKHLMQNATKKTTDVVQNQIERKTHKINKEFHNAKRALVPKKATKSTHNLTQNASKPTPSTDDQQQSTTRYKKGNR